MFAFGSNVASTSKATLSNHRLCCRGFRTSRCALARAKNHYETLDLPRSATRQQIKAQFYRLSKEYHPDVKSGNEVKFQAISEAYATLGNADARKSYDANLSAGSHSGGHNASQASGSGYHYYSPESESFAGRRARANYAWDYARRTNPRYQHQPRNSPQGAHTHQAHNTHQHETHFDRMQAREAWRASNMSSGARKRAIFESEQMAKEEDLRNTSGIGRAVQFVAMFFAVLWIGGTLKAGAWEKTQSEASEHDEIARGPNILERETRQILDSHA